jgi:hypothetical protein
MKDFLPRWLAKIGTSEFRRKTSRVQSFYYCYRAQKAASAIRAVATSKVEDVRLEMAPMRTVKSLDWPTWVTLWLVKSVAS